MLTVPGLQCVTRSLECQRWRTRGGWFLHPGNGASLRNGIFGDEIRVKRRVLCVRADVRNDVAGLVDKQTENAPRIRGGRNSLKWRKRGKLSGNTKPVSSTTGHWRIYRVEVPVQEDPGKDHIDLFDALLEKIAVVLGCPASQLPSTAFSVVRKSLDARKELKFVYTVDISVEEFLKKTAMGDRILSTLRPEQGKAEFSLSATMPTDLVSQLQSMKQATQEPSGVFQSEEVQPQVLEQQLTNQPRSPMNVIFGTAGTQGLSTGKKSKVTVVGSGPAGLFAALVLAESGVDVVVLERGQPVESRGRDIGALMVRGVLDPNSNLCFGEGGAGTWSDGKLTTRIGKNSDSVQTVLQTLVRFGAPANILVDGKPHIGTDKLVRILRLLRLHLQSIGVNILFGTKMEDLVVHGGRVSGVKIRTVKGDSMIETRSILCSDAVVLAVGHSARDVYEQLLGHNVSMTPKDFAVGFRVEHPQELINKIQYAKWASEVQRGKGKLPVADYKVTAEIPAVPGRLPREDGPDRGCFSFCMCPGGQVVPTSTSPSELCINGMSFSKRASKWANAALVVSVSTPDISSYLETHGSLAGVAFQRAIEREAALRGGGRFVVPVQSVPDFLNGKLSGGPLPSSSYRLGVRAAFLHDLLPLPLIESLQQALVVFDKQLPGFINDHALLHGVETRTSSPLKIDRWEESYESVSMAGLFPIGEGAGYAGGIVSAAVDGMNVGFALSRQLNLSSVPKFI